MIAHRLSTLDHCDMRLEIRDGRLFAAKEVFACVECRLTALRLFERRGATCAGTVEIIEPICLSICLVSECAGARLTKNRH